MFGIPDPHFSFCWPFTLLQLVWQAHYFQLLLNMFHYSEIPEIKKDRQKCDFYKDYCKVLYESPQLKSSEDIGCEPTWVTYRFKSHAERIKAFAVRSDDVWIASYPKTGTTLAAEMVSVLLSNLDYSHIETTDIAKRVHFLEYVMDHIM